MNKKSLLKTILILTLVMLLLLSNGFVDEDLFYGSLTIEKEVLDNPSDTTTFTAIVTSTGGYFRTVEFSQGNPVTLHELEYGDYTIEENYKHGYVVPLPQTIALTTTSKTITLVNEIVNPDITVVKTADEEEVYPGDIITYTVTLTNTGNVTMFGEIIDPLTGLFRWFNIPVSSSQSITTTMEAISVGAITNTAIAYSTWDEMQIITVTDSAIVTVLPYGELTIEKQVLGDDSDTTTFSALVTGPNGYYEIVDFSQNNAVTLSQLELGTYTVTEQVDWGYIEQPEQTITLLTESISETVTFINEIKSPAMNIVKTADKDEVYPGDVITYTITITNTGNIELFDINVTDSLTELDETIDVLNVLDSQSFTTTMEAITLGAITNIATGNVCIPDIELITVTDSAIVSVVDPPVYGLQIEKVADDYNVEVGDTITYTITVTNIGEELLEGITVTDPLIGLNESIELLDVSSSQAFTGTLLTTQTGTIENIATAENTLAGVATDSAVVTVASTPPPPKKRTYKMTIDKEADKYEAYPGEEVNYTIVVKNTGNATLTNIKVIDVKVGLDEVITLLTPNKTKTFEVSAIMPDGVGNFDNTAIAEDNRAGKVSDTETVLILEKEKEKEEEDTPEVPDEEIPLDIPDTGTIPMGIVYTTGALISALGYIILKRKGRK